MPCSWYPILSETGPRPTATINNSAVNDLPSSNVTVTSFLFLTAEANLTPNSRLIPRLRNALSSCLLEDSSSRAINRGRPSTIVTSLPNDFQTDANSEPITPPPRTMTLFGT